MILAAVNVIFQRLGFMLKAETVVDATLVSALSSTKNESGECDPEMHQTKKGNQRYFGMKAHLGRDAESGLVHTVAGTAANVNDVTIASLQARSRSIRAVDGRNSIELFRQTLPEVPMCLHSLLRYGLIDLS